MNYGLYVSASGVLTNMYRQDVYAHNLSNANTVGYKPDVATVQQRDPETIEDQIFTEESHELLDRLGGGVFAGPQSINFSAQPAVSTGRPLDVALTGQNEFFAVRHTNPRTGDSEVRLTRDGRFHRNGEGQLVAAASGMPVLDVNDAPIELGIDAKIDNAGRIVENGEVVAQIQVALVKDTDRLAKAGTGLFRVYGNNPNEARQVLDMPSVEPGFSESSGVDPIKALMQMIAATKAVSSNGTMIRYHDSLMEQAVNVLGRVS